MRHRTARTLLAASLALLAGCDAFAACGARPVAVVTKVEGEVARASASAPDRWSPAEIDAELAMGDAIRTGERSTARLLLDDGSVIDLEPSSTLRLLLEAPGDESPTLEVLAGAVSLSTDDDAEIATRGGRARLGAGSRVELRRTEEGFALTLTVGRARLAGDEGGEIELVAGVPHAISAPGRATATTTPSAAPTAATAAPTAEPAPRTVRATLSGDAHEVRAAGSDEWTTLEDGVHTLGRGARLRQGAGGSVELADGERQLTLRGGGEFVVGDGARLATIVSGTPSITTNDEGIAIATEGGVLVTRPAEGGRADAELARRDDGSLALEVSAGAIEVRRGDATEVVEAGGSTTLAPMHAESVDAADATASIEPTGEDDALDHQDLAVPAGGNFVVRDTAPPTIIALGFGDECPDGAVVERLRGARGRRVEATGRGARSVSLAFPAGIHGYQVRCLEDGTPSRRPIARGRVQVVRSSGQAPLPRSAPESRVDADGRTYTVLYQNQLPSISVRWPSGAPGAGTLVVRSRGATRRVPVRGPEHRFAAGQLADGVHTLYFEAASGGRRSRETTVRVRFDETAASASLVEPAAGSFAPGERVRVSGSVLDGWRVVAGDTEIPVGRDQRFSGHALVPASGVLVVKLSKPGQGAHYYVRRARSRVGAQ